MVLTGFFYITGNYHIRSYNSFVLQVTIASIVMITILYYSRSCDTTIYEQICYKLEVFILHASDDLQLAT